MEDSRIQFTVAILSTVLFLVVVISGRILLLCCVCGWRLLQFPLCLVVSLQSSTEVNDVGWFVLSTLQLQTLKKRC